VAIKGITTLQYNEARVYPAGSTREFMGSLGIACGNASILVQDDEFQVVVG
jgi:hypothetical protein